MRFRHRDHLVHLAYCTNVHPAEDLAGVIAQLDRYAVPVRERLGAERLGLGLWLAAPAAAEVRARPGQLRAELAARGLEVVTLNGFPYAGFQQPVVKGAVYRPDWAEPERPAYTVDLAWALAGLLPEDVMHGSISTLPLCWRSRWSSGWADTARAGLEKLRRELEAVESATGRTVRIGFEPEPGCVIETVDQAVALLKDLDPRYFGVCLDTCHLAVMHEEPREALDKLTEAGLPVVKVQASAALEARDPARARQVLERFVEPRFLHQTRAGAHGADDLDEALAVLPDDLPWRVHFHIPLHADPPPPLAGTRPVLRQTLAELFAGDGVHHIEVETYTWDVLPGRQDDLAGGIAAELAWTRDTLTELGLEEA
ncbi:metabolite traffic protein EboE [Nonomuraea lactucae]|uniref:metabolite traffic protein EboE n=1 Tax=Nonomuraea lactucae TaxID=2249762 RepID=UPI000DE1F00B|nr:metabolite traffic protein EboE [Nonomuraea lactucae]